MIDSFRNCLFLFLAVSGLLGCQSDDADVSDPDAALFDRQQATIEQFLTEQNIATQQTEAGIHYQVLTENDSGVSPEAGQVINLYYRVEQLEGGLIDERQASSGHNPIVYTYKFTDPNPRRFHLILPVSLDDMVGLMRKGEEYEFYLPSRLAYLDFSLPDRLPSESIVRFRIQVADILTPAEQRHVEDARIKTYLADHNFPEADSLPSGVYYVRTKTGEGAAVGEGSRVKVLYTGSLLDDSVFDSNVATDRDPYEITIGRGGAIEGFVRGVEQMRLGEKGTVVMPSHAAYQEGLIAIPYTFIGDLLDQNFLDPEIYGFAREIPPYSPLRFDIEIVEVN